MSTPDYIVLAVVVVSLAAWWIRSQQIYSALWSAALGQPL